MRIALLPVAALALIAADDAATEVGENSADTAPSTTAPTEAPPALLMPSYQLTQRQKSMIAEAQIKAAEPLKSPHSSQSSQTPDRMIAKGQIMIDERSLISPSRAECQDRITKARELLGEPPLFDREPASPANPHLIYAVDRRQDGCSVMVMKGNPSDIRQLPLPMDGNPLMPAKGVEE